MTSTTTSTDVRTDVRTDAATAEPPAVAPGTVQVWSDLLCPFTHLALHRLREARERLGLAVPVEHRTFAVELFEGPHPRRGTDTEAVGVGQVAPELDWRVWAGPDETYPHTVLLAAEAVHSAQAQSLAAGEALDLALRRAFWTGSRTISMRATVLAVAGEVRDAGTDLDVAALTAALDTGRHRAVLAADHLVASTHAIAASPTFRLADGTSVTNPGTDVTWAGPWAAGFPRVLAHDPGALDDLVRRAAATA